MGYYILRSRYLTNECSCCIICIYYGLMVNWVGLLRCWDELFLLQKNGDNLYIDYTCEYYFAEAIVVGAPGNNGENLRKTCAIPTRHAIDHE